MLIKIKREDCLRLYNKFPLYSFHFSTDKEVVYYPKLFATHWLKLESKSKNGLTKLLSKEINQLLYELKINKLIFLAESKNTWITKLSKERVDYKPLNEAIKYLSDNKIGGGFQGGIQVNSNEISIFLQHLYTLISCDASLPDINFIDEEQNIIGYIHYSGEVRIDTLNKKYETLFINAVNKTRFINVERG